MFMVFLQTQKFSGKVLPPPDSDDELAIVSSDSEEEAEIVPFDKKS